MLDASVLIAHLDADNVHHERAERLLLREAGDRFGASSITLAEVFVLPVRIGRVDATRVALALLDVEEIALGEGSAISLGRLRAETALKLPDCCVLLAAESRHARLASFDDRLSSRAKARGLDTLTS